VKSLLLDLLSRGLRLGSSVWSSKFDAWLEWAGIRPAKSKENGQETMASMNLFFRYGRFKLKDDSGGNEFAPSCLPGSDRDSLRKPGHLLDEMAGFDSSISASSHQMR
jgi:hypothetical protein